MRSAALLPTYDYRRTAALSPGRLHRGLDALVHGWAGRLSRRGSRQRALRTEAEKVHALAADLTNWSEAVLKQKLAELGAHFRRGDKRDDALLHAALAAVAECARRRLGLRPHAVQLMGALAVGRGFLLEMATGEGKTLTVALAAAIQAWNGRPCHVITANDYLAARDAAWLSDFYAFCGLRVGCVTAEMKSEERRANYACDITYATSKEIVADFLRDRLQLGPLTNSTRRLLRSMLQPARAAADGLVMRGLHTAIVDEADSALIDEAVTPLIISQKEENEPLREACIFAHKLARALIRGEDYALDARREEILLRPPGLAKLAERATELPAMWRGAQRRSELVTQALRALELFHRDKHYVIENGEVVIVDEFTGRLMHQRTWREGLHQAVEAKEGLPVTAPSETLARLSFQRFFRMYPRLAGLSGTIWEAAAEVWQIYRLPSVRIPTNRPCRRVELPDRIFATQQEKWAAVAEEIAARHARRQPVLVGTRSVAASEQIARMLEAQNLPFQLLNAVRHSEEAGIIAKAGQQGRITIATNMAGRGTDIKLGPLVAEIGGLHVILTERHESRRIDRQLMGRAARQGESGSAQAFVSLDDELLRRHAPGWLRARIAAALAAGAPGAARLAQLLVDRAQANAEKEAFRQRKRVLEMDEWVEEALSFVGSE